MVELAEEDASSSDDGEDLEANASDEVQHIAGDLPVPTQGTTGSFSSLIDYNPDNASDRSEAASSPPTSARSGSAPVTSVCVYVSCGENNTDIPPSTSNC